MNGKWKLYVCCVVLILALALPGLVQAKMITETYKKVDGFVFLIDASDSTASRKIMGMSRFDAQAALLKKMNGAIPDLGYTAGLRTFGYRPLVQSANNPGTPVYSKLDWGVAAFNRAAYGKAVEAMTAMRSLTPLGPGMADVKADLDAIKGKKALIIMSDFESSPEFGDPLAEAKKLADQYGADLCIYTIPFSTGQAEVALADKMAKAAGCGAVYNPETVLADQAAFDAMIMDIFWGKKEVPCPDDDQDGVCNDEDKCPGTPTSVKVDEVGCPKMVKERESITLNIQFDTAKWDVKNQYHLELKKVADFMNLYTGTSADIEGHTDSQGSEKYNQELSQKRAESVRQYLIDNFGLSADRLKAVGYGESRPIADNATVEGRQVNRRVVAVITATTRKMEKK